jgi:hypothetical protein
MNKFVWALSKNVANWQQYTARLSLKAKKNRNIVGSASVDYLMFSGYIMMGYFWAQMAQTAYEKLAGDVENRDFYRAKIKTAEFYFERLLPRTKSLAATMMADPKTLMQLDEDLLSFL